MKKIIKMEMLNKRESLSKEYCIDYSNRLVDKIKQLPIYKNLNTIAIFYPLNNEINLLNLNDKRICFPKVINKDILFYENTNKFEKGPFNIMEPLSNIIVDKEEIDAIFIPLLAYDSRLHRIGYGKGYYDRYLKDYKGLKIGVAYPFMKVPYISNNEFDVALDMVVVL